jgi:hypothetical protein
VRQRAALCCVVRLGTALIGAELQQVQRCNWRCGAAFCGAVRLGAALQYAAVYCTCYTALYGEVRCGGALCFAVRCCAALHSTVWGSAALGGHCGVLWCTALCDTVLPCAALCGAVRLYAVR